MTSPELVAVTRKVKVSVFDDHDWVVHPAISVQLATYENQDFENGVCVLVHDHQTKDVLIEMIFPDIEILERTTELLAYFAAAGRFMKTHGFDEATRHFDLANTNLDPQTIEADLEAAIGQILGEDTEPR